MSPRLPNTLHTVLVTYIISRYCRAHAAQVTHFSGRTDVIDVQRHLAEIGRRVDSLKLCKRFSCRLSITIPGLALSTALVKKFHPLRFSPTIECFK